MQINQIHTDIETVDTKASAQMLSIGAVCGVHEFYCEIDRSLYDVSAFSVSQDTLDWWIRQGGFKPSVDPVSPNEAMALFSNWIYKVSEGIRDVEIWANSPSFDCAILQHHFEYFALAPAWKFFQERDVRTVKALARNLHLQVQEFQNPHNALQDARNQQMYVDSVYMTLGALVQNARDTIPSLTLDTVGDDCAEQFEGGGISDGR